MIGYSATMMIMPSRRPDGNRGRVCRVRRQLPVTEVQRSVPPSLCSVPSHLAVRPAKF